MRPRARTLNAERLACRGKRKNVPRQFIGQQGGERGKAIAGRNVLVKPRPLKRVMAESGPGMEPHPVVPQAVES